MISDNECVQVRIRNPEKENHRQSKNGAREPKLQIVMAQALEIASVIHDMLFAEPV